jgi:hypothetical protein
MRVVEFITFPDIDAPDAELPAEPNFALRTSCIGKVFPWEEFIIQFNEEDRETVNNYRDAIIAEGIRCSPRKHQNGTDIAAKTCAVFEDGTIAYWGCRDWSAMMAAIWSYAENKRYGSHDFI